MNAPKSVGRNLLVRWLFAVATGICFEDDVIGRSATYEYPGNVITKVGEFEIRHTLTEYNEDEIYGGTVVTTAKHGRVEVLFPRPSRIEVVIAPYTSMRFPENEREELSIMEGMALFFKRFADRDVAVRVGNFHASIKGTSFMARASPGRSEFIVIDGEIEVKVDVTNQRTAAGPSVESILVPSFHKLTLEMGREPRLDQLEVLGADLQWFLFYPMILDLNPADWGDVGVWAPIAKRYASGDTFGAFSMLREIPGAPEAERPLELFAMLMLGFGNVGESEAALEKLPENDPERAAIQLLIDVVTGREIQLERLAGAGSDSNLPVSLLLARSYALQRENDLDAALVNAREAVARSPRTGFAHFRLAELLSYFGRRAQAVQALDSALEKSPKLPPARALRGLLEAEYSATPSSPPELALTELEDPYPQTWLVNGLLRLREGDSEAGLRYLLIGVAKSPLQSTARVLLAEGWKQAGESSLQLKELHAAMELDDRDPTAYFFRALAHRDANRLNAAIGDLRNAFERNANRRLFRSNDLLRMDSAVRRANIAAVYEDAGLSEWALREASLAVADDHRSGGSHQFLANSYDILRDQSRLFLRYNTAWRSEQLLANLLAPSGSAVLPRHASLQEFSPILMTKQAGVNVGSRYRSDSAWDTRGTAYATSGGLSVAYDLEHRSYDGYDQIDSFELQEHTLRLRFEPSDRDAVFLQTNVAELESGDFRLLREGGVGAPTIQFEEEVGPNGVFGFCRQWSVSAATLFAAGRIESHYTARDRARSMITLVDVGGELVQADRLAIALDRMLDTSIVTGFAELQHIQTLGTAEVVAGLRTQRGEFETDESLMLVEPAYSAWFSSKPVSDQATNAELSRTGGYAYLKLDLPLGLTPIFGASYSKMSYPINFRQPPVVSGNRATDEMQPKLGVIWSPSHRLMLQALHAESLGGVSLDTSYQLEPTQVAGLLQSYRTLIPEALFGSTSGQRHEIDALRATFDMDGEGKARFSFDAANRKSSAKEFFGSFTRFVPEGFFRPSQSRVELNFQERELSGASQFLVGDRWSIDAGLKRLASRAEFRLLDVKEDLSQGVNTIDESVSWHGKVEASLILPSGLYFKARLDYFDQEDRVREEDSRDQTVAFLGGTVGFSANDGRYQVELGVENARDEYFLFNRLADDPDQPRERTIFVAARFNL